MNNKIYDEVFSFRKKYPFSMGWRLGLNASVAKKFIDFDEEIHYAFFAQKNDNSLDIFATSVIAITSKRIIIAQKRVLWGYSLASITPDMFNDLTIKMGLIWGKICIDTIKETVIFSNIQKEALPEIENAITNYIAIKKNSFNKNL